MTTYILAGGNDRANSDYGSRLAAEVLKRITAPISLVSCFYAWPEEEWGAKVQDWKPWFRQIFGAELTYRYIPLNEFPNTVHTADVLYLHGGDNDLMLDRLGRYDNLADIFSGKVIIGSSAGVNALAKSFWTRSKCEKKTGLGILPIHVMTHYGSFDGGYPDSVRIDWDEADKMMEADSGKDIMRLPEGTFQVIEI